MTRRNVFHIELMAGTDYENEFIYIDPVTGLPIDVTGCSADMKVRENMNDTYDGQYNDVYVMHLSSGTEGGITIGGTDGKITLNISADQVTDLLWNRCVYDMILTTAAGKKVPFVGGFFVVISSAD